MKKLENLSIELPNNDLCKRAKNIDFLSDLISNATQLKSLSINLEYNELGKDKSKKSSI